MLLRKSDSFDGGDDEHNGIGFMDTPNASVSLKLGHLTEYTI